jgi:hypothetical protein
LEVLRVLRAEVDLRELTRAAEQAKPGLEISDFTEQAQGLSKTQFDLHQRIVSVIDQVETLQLEEGRNFSKDLAKLHVAESAMSDATDILAQPDTGGRAIAAETEAIEALLETRRGGSGGGGGGGTVPGGSHAAGTAKEGASALQGLADGMEAESRIVQQATGTADSGIPEEFRTGLDSYFSELEK